MKRLDFIKTAALAFPVSKLFSSSFSYSNSKSISNNKLEKRLLGKTGEKLSVLGFGGIIVMNETPENASSIIKFAIDAGVNYFDVAPTYGDAELKLGDALEPYRNDVFLSCKTMKRNKIDAQKELEQSLKNLHTDHFDLYQLHAVSSLEDVNTILGKEGALEAFTKAREEGTIRFIGFSAHSVDAAIALMNSFDFDTIMFPVNFAIWNKGNFRPNVLELAKEKNMGIIALKAMAKGPWSRNADKSKHPKLWYEPLEIEKDILMGLRFALTQPITTALTPGEAGLFKIAVNLRDQFKPLSDEEMLRIKLEAENSNPLFSHQIEMKQ